MSKPNPKNAPAQFDRPASLDKALDRMIDRAKRELAAERKGVKQ